MKRTAGPSGRSDKRCGLCWIWKTFYLIRCDDEFMVMLLCAGCDSHAVAVMLTEVSA